MTGPHDPEAQRLETSLRETSVGIFEQTIEMADRLMGDAQEALARVPEPRTAVERLLLGHFQATVAGSLYGQIAAKMYLDAERQAVQHQRAHIDQADRDSQRHATASTALNDAMSDAIARLRKQGINLEAMPGGFAIIPPDSEGPNS